MSNKAKYEKTSNTFSRPEELDIDKFGKHNIIETLGIGKEAIEVLDHNTTQPHQYTNPGRTKGSKS